MDTFVTRQKRKKTEGD